jgi:ribosomal protein S18 acetylase RimI-like enzyme
MASNSLKIQHRTWSRDNYLISTDPFLIPIPKLNAYFASEDVYWCSSLPEDAMLEMLQNSLCFGLFQNVPRTHQNTQPSDAATAPFLSPDNFIGLARGVIDSTTFFYLTDVYIDPLYQGKGLGTWMMKCVQEVIESMPYLRRSLLFTGDWKRSVPFYEKILGMEVAECRKGEDGGGQGLATMMRKGRGHPDFVGKVIFDRDS